MAESGPGPQTVTCPSCGRSVPPMAHCVECGHPLGPDASAIHAGYAASPRESIHAIRLFTTLFPHLPHREIDGFRAAFIAGLVLVVLLVLAGAYPLALVCSALLVPLLFLLYFFAVDIYEGEPRLVILWTLAWGLGAGIVAGLAVRAIAFSTSRGGVALPPEIVIRDGVAVPILEATVAVLGPLFLLRYRSFDDVLDGATFGAISASVMAGAVVLVRSFDLLRSGFLPGGDAYPWLVDVTTIGIAWPVVFAASVGSVCASFWLRFRAPVRDRSSLGPLGRPAVACVSAAVLLGVAGLSRVLLGPLPALLVVGATAITVLLWLRLTIHVGLREEAAAGGDRSEVRCGECGRETPRAAFCGHCGVALRALPLAAGTRSAAASASGDRAITEPAAAAVIDTKGSPGAEGAPAPTRGRRLKGRRAIAAYVTGLLVVLGIGIGLMVYLAPHTPQSPCPPLPAPCAGPPVNPPGPPAPLPHGGIPQVLVSARATDAQGNCVPSVGSIGRELILGKVMPLREAGIAFIYDDCVWVVGEADGSHAILQARYTSHPWGTLRIEAVPTATRSPQDEVLFLRAQDAGLNARLDTADYYRINGPAVGYVTGDATGENFSGTVFGTDGLPVGPGEWSYVAASDGTTTVAVEVFDQLPDELLQANDTATFHDLTRQYADVVLKDVRWSPAQ